MDVDLQFSQMSLSEGNYSLGQRVRHAGLETYHRSGLAPTPQEHRIITLGHASILDLIDRSPATSQLCTLFPLEQERHDLLARFQGLSFSCPLLTPPSQDELLIHSHVCLLLAEHAGLLDTRTYVLRQMLEGGTSACDELMLLLIMVDALIHRPTWLAGQEGSPQDWMSVLWRPLLERILLASRQSETDLAFEEYGSSFPPSSLPSDLPCPTFTMSAEDSDGSSSARIRVARGGQQSIDAVAIRVLPPGPPDTTKDSVGSKILCEAKSIVDSLTALPVHNTNTILTNIAYGIEIEGRTAVIFSMRWVASQPCYLAWPEHRFTLPATGEGLGAFKEAIRALFWLRERLQDTSARVQASII
ncbi:hypothetical protein BG006_003256 [Podila minutissima]|uniref:Uncharacterized protein n=1 Tax=Podila minutissima TaxID=64525 RepID=A0A9P5S8S0_9FUNG|nr:hypothetical protein BG006_003256 [Podila minutissima]